MSVDHSDYAYFNKRMPPREQWPVFRYELPHLQLPDVLNVGSWLLDTPLAYERGEVPALIGATETWTYLEFHHHVCALADEFAGRGVGVGDRVVLIGWNAPRLVAAWYATLRVGAVACCLPPLSSAHYVAQVVERVEPDLVVCDAATADTVVWGVADRAPLRVLDGVHARGQVDFAPPAEGRRSFRPAVPTSADAPCIIAFTSGSTGCPKAVVHSHREVAAMCRCFVDGALGATADEIFVGSSPLAFTFGLLSQACYPVALGATSVLLPWPNPEAMLAAVVRHRATFCFSVPTTYRRWLRAHGGELRTLLASVRVAVASGEPLSASMWRDFHESGGVRLINVMGSTEMLHAFMSTGPYDAPPGSIGGPVAGYRIRLLDPAGEELSGVATGLLAVQGPTGCRYLDDPRQQQQVVDGWNLTDDLAHRDERGFYWIEGRADSIIVSAGYKISPVEVEHCLMESSAVDDVLVTALPDDERGAIVMALVVLAADRVGDEAIARELVEYVASRLVRYKAPRAFRFVSELPRTASGKVVRRARLMQPASTTIILD